MQHSLEPRFRYTNNSVQDFADVCEAAAGAVANARDSSHLRRRIGFYILTGGSGSGKTRMGSEICQLVRSKAEASAVDSIQAGNSTLWKSAEAFTINFKGGGDPLTMQDGVLSASCMLGLRLAARHIFCCSVQNLRRVLPSQHENLYSFEEVMSYLADQQRSALQIDNSVVLLQVVTIDDFQLVRTQAQAFLPNPTQATALVNSMVELLGGWMISGVQQYAGVVVLIGTGLEFGKTGLRGYRKIARTVNILTDDQVELLMKTDILSRHMLSPEDVDTFLKHPLMRAQIRMLMGLPSFMLMALNLLLTHLATLPGTEEEIRQLAGNVMQGLRLGITLQVGEDLSALTLDFLFKLLLLSLTDLQVHPKRTRISSELSLDDASTVSGIIWTKPCGDDYVQAVLQPIVQHHAAEQLLQSRQMLHQASLLQDIKASLPYPFTSMGSGFSREKLVAISLAAKLNLISEGFGVHVAKTCSWQQLLSDSVCGEYLSNTLFEAQPVRLARDSHQIITKGGNGLTMDVSPRATLCEVNHNGVMALDWGDDDFLVFMDAHVGPQAPSGDLRMMVRTMTGKRQMAIIQCKKSGDVSAVKDNLQLLRDCVQRWNTSHGDQAIELVFIWITTAKASPKLASYSRQQQDLIIVDQAAIRRLCPLLHYFPELYKAEPGMQESTSSSRLQLATAQPSQKGQPARQPRKGPKRPQAHAHGKVLRYTGVTPFSTLSHGVKQQNISLRNFSWIA
ncbi:hypothetical protein ABBQ38_012866 [Trebouxia sp. C0009 RCD-2024]